MFDLTPQAHRPRELARRENDGVHVALLWHPNEDALTVTVADARSGECFELPVERRRALHTVHHPSAYAA
jgi:hypothetical protein